MKFIIFLITIHLNIFGYIYGANVLFVSAPASASHRRSMYPLAETLAKLGHSVTMFSEIMDEHDNAVGKNITNKNIFVKMDEELVKQREAILHDMMWKERQFSPIKMMFPWLACTEMTNKLLEQQKQEFNLVINKSWDVIFVDAIFSPTGVLFWSLLHKPCVLFQTTAIGVPEALYRSIPYPASSFPALFLLSFDYNENIFWERLLSTWSETLYLASMFLVNNFIIKPKLSPVSPNISLPEFYGEADSSFVDYPISLDYPRPMTPDIISIGGKCKSSAVLQDKSLLEFVEDPKSKGTIVVAFGHMVEWHTAPTEVQHSLANGLNDLKDYRIIWQYKGEPPIKMESHVKTMAWLPQAELLNHPKTKVFISHGGLKSIMESICARVPIALIPFFAEQTRNGVLLKHAMAGEIIKKYEITRETIVKTVKQIASDEGYRVGITKLKIAILDKPIPPEQNALFWTDFIIRHKGLPNKWFRVKGYTMNWIKYFCIDILLAFTIVVALLIYIVIRLAKVAKKFIK